MLIEKRLIKQATQVFSKLSADVLLLDDQGDVLVPAGEMPHVIPQGLEEGTFVQSGGYVYVVVPTQPDLLLACRGDLPSAGDVLTLAVGMVDAMLQSSEAIENEYDVYRRVLREDISGTELEALAHEHQIPMSIERSVMVFHVVHTEKSSAFALLRELIPQTEGDEVVEIDRHTVALLKDMSNMEGEEELVQFAQAVQESLMVETASHTTVGIGDRSLNLSTLGESYRQARRAMEVGTIFQLGSTVFVFTHMMLERFLSEIPRDIASHYHAILFNRKTARLFNEEMLHTIEMFFEKDLNLSDTARQLYIHRNTLVYRLDKVQRQTGLDLRNFRDAVTFKILLELRKSGSEKPKQIH